MKMAEAEDTIVVEGPGDLSAIDSEAGCREFNDLEPSFLRT
jgi:5S rRNA maturation endonuclease (ribonuclease M5)